jgi:hypothetical protein
MLVTPVRMMQNVSRNIYMNHNSLKRAPHPPYSPDLAPSDFYQFGYVKHQLQGHEFTEGAEIISAISEEQEEQEKQEQEQEQEQEQQQEQQEQDQQEEPDQ